MNKSPWIFLGVLFALSLSWWGMVFGPASQVNAAKVDLGDGTSLRPRSGLAQQGEQIYRENGCYYCHTRTATGGTFGYEIQITQFGADEDLTREIIGEKYAAKKIFEKAFAFKAVAAARDAKKAASEEVKAEGADVEAAEAALEQAAEALKDAKEAANAIKIDETLIALGISGVTIEGDLAGELGLPIEMSEGDKAEVANATFAVSEGVEQWEEIKDTVRALKDRAGAQFKLLPLADDWPDVVNGVARRQSVSRDFLFDAHAMPGVMRVGPCLSNVGARQIDLNALYAKIYNSQAGGQSSHMPPYKYLFNVRAAEEDEKLPANAVTISTEGGVISVESGFVVTPTTKARALAAYLQSLRNDKGLPEAPLPAVRVTNNPEEGE